MKDPNWEQINSEKRRDILWCAAWNQAATIWQGKGIETDPKIINKLAQELFNQMYAPYEKEWGNLVKGSKEMVNIDAEIPDNYLN
jgi:hypothetical protein